MSTIWRNTKGSGGIDPPTVDDLEDETPELIDIYARAWDRRARDAVLVWTKKECLDRAVALYAHAEKLRSTMPADPSMAVLADAPNVYAESGTDDDEPTAERDKPKPKMCYVCARNFSPDELVLRLASGAAVCGLCVTVMEPDAVG